MTRLKLFLFYTAMAWASVFNPAEGRKMIDAAERDTDRRMEEKVWRMHLPVGHPERAFPLSEPENPVGVGTALFAALALVVTLGWLVFGATVLLGWLE